MKEDKLKTENPVERLLQFQERVDRGSKSSMYQLGVHSIKQQ